MSAKFSPTAPWRTRTSPGPGSPTSAVSNRRTSRSTGLVETNDLRHCVLLLGPGPSHRDDARIRNTMLSTSFRTDSGVPCRLCRVDHRACLAVMDPTLVGASRKYLSLRDFHYSIRDAWVRLGSGARLRRRGSVGVGSTARRSTARRRAIRSRRSRGRDVRPPWLSRTWLSRIERLICPGAISVVGVGGLRWGRNPKTRMGSRSSPASRGPCRRHRDRRCRPPPRPPARRARSGPSPHPDQEDR